MEIFSKLIEKADSMFNNHPMVLYEKEHFKSFQIVLLCGDFRVYFDDIYKSLKSVNTNDYYILKMDFPFTVYKTYDENNKCFSESKSSIDNFEDFIYGLRVQDVTFNILYNMTDYSNEKTEEDFLEKLFDFIKNKINIDFKGINIKINMFHILKDFRNKSSLFTKIESLVDEKKCGDNIGNIGHFILSDILETSILQSDDNRWKIVGRIIIYNGLNDYIYSGKRMAIQFGGIWFNSHNILINSLKILASKLYEELKSDKSYEDKTLLEKLEMNDSGELLCLKDYVSRNYKIDLEVLKYLPRENERNVFKIITPEDNENYVDKETMGGWSSYIDCQIEKLFNSETLYGFDTLKESYYGRLGEKLDLDEVIYYHNLKFFDRILNNKNVKSVSSYDDISINKIESSIYSRRIIGSSVYNQFTEIIDKIEKKANCYYEEIVDFINEASKYDFYKSGLDLFYYDLIEKYIGENDFKVLLENWSKRSFYEALQDYLDDLWMYILKYMNLNNLIDTMDTKAAINKMIKILSDSSITYIRTNFGLNSDSEIGSVVFINDNIKIRNEMIDELKQSDLNIHENINIIDEDKIEFLKIWELKTADYFDGEDKNV